MDFNHVNGNPGGAVTLKERGCFPHTDTCWHAVVLDGREIEGMTVGDQLTLSQGNRFAALEEWVLPWSEGVRTRVVIIDTQTKEYARGPVIKNAYLDAITFCGQEISYGTSPVEKTGAVPETHVTVLEQLQWEKFAFKKPEPPMIWDPVIDARRLTALKNALPLLEQADVLLASVGKRIDGAEQFRKDIRDHAAGDRAGPDNPDYKAITFSRLGCLHAYPFRLRNAKLDNDLAAALEALVKSLDVNGPDSKPRPAQTPQP